MAARFTCSIDDGHPADLRCAELLARRGLKATFYVPVRNREGPPVLGRSALRELGREFEIGAHTLDHCFLPALPAAQAAHQIGAGKDALEQRLGRAVTGFCYPGGKHGAREVALVRQAGFAYARTVRNLCLDAGADRFRMPTTLQFYPHSPSVVLRNFLSQPGRGARWPAARAALAAPDLRTRLAALLDLADASGGLFHIWWHSLDIERLGLWPLLDDFLRAVAERTAPELRQNNAEAAAAIDSSVSAR